MENIYRKNTISTVKGRSENCQVFASSLSSSPLLWRRGEEVRLL